MFCNRGVSGIDGCTSTAIGGAQASGRATLLITGDMSFHYDIGALALPGVPASMRIVAIDNEGGAIFRYARSTKGLNEREQLFCQPAGILPSITRIGELYGWQTAEAGSLEQLHELISGGWLNQKNSRPQLLTIKIRNEKEVKNLFL